MTPSSALRRVVVQVLAQESGNSRTSAELAEVTARVYEQFVYRLIPLIGEAGIQAIFTRGVKLTQARYPFLTWESAAGADQSAPMQIWNVLKEQEPATIRMASEALLITFAQLVANLIGEQLAWLLLFGLSPEALSLGPSQGRTE